MIIKRMKELMIKISKAERFELEKQGVVCGENGISRTLGKGRKKTYYLCESRRNLDLLNKIRKN